MTDYNRGSYARAPRSEFDLSDYYLMLLSGVLMGYALGGKGFAYLGVPPIFIGEIAFLTGLAIFLRTGCLIASLTTLPSLLLAITMAWVLLRTLPFLDTYGFDALRDSAVIMYGGFTFIVIALLLEHPRRIETIFRYYGAFLSIFVPAIPFIFAFTHYLPDYTNLPAYSSGEVAVHLAGAAVFVLAGFRKMAPLSIVALLAALVMIFPTSRGAMLAFVVPVIIAALTLGKMREMAIVLVTGLGLLGAAYAVETAITDNREVQSSDERPVSARQIIENVASIFGQSGEQTEGTKTWRIEWWNIIINNTLYGPNFWSGRGFGLNLADADGFRNEHDAPALRSPHNAHMTILARAGVPGVVLWFLLLASWFGMLINAMLGARRRGQIEWAGLFLFVGCYVLAIVINASFDVALEGPMQGIWFWCLFGFGIGSVMIYRHRIASPFGNAN